MNKLFNNVQFWHDVLHHRKVTAGLSLDDASREIGISKSTLHRIEDMKSMDIETFAKVCYWMQVNPSDYFQLPKYLSE